MGRAAAALIAGLVVMLSGCGGAGTHHARSASPPAAAAAIGSSPGRASVGTATTVSATVTPVPVVCPPLPASGPAGSNLTFSGRCSFREHRALPCPNTAVDADAFHIRFTRQLRHDLTMQIVMTLEGYKGPGRYAGGNRIIVQVFDNSAIYEWSTGNGAMTIDPGARSGSIPRTALPPAIGTPTRGIEYVAGDFTCSA